WASASPSVAPGFTGMGPPARRLLAALVGARDPPRLGRPGFDPELQDIDQELVELCAPAWHALPERGLVGEVAGDLVVHEAGVGAGVLGVDAQPAEGRRRGVLRDDVDDLRVGGAGLEDLSTGLLVRYVAAAHRAARVEDLALDALEGAGGEDH